ncbi:arginine vasopressin-induced protein 1 isoform X1 [Salmo trutta]|uniref:arginine vasopressin-induced protein 1 isoform X1 n=2 Tax=Salmo trutta TaxID=8032 RepID=UPI00113087C7|nr:arginine vasopressin-induced protein 1 isoform X1 [Salmo trutta]
MGLFRNAAHLAASPTALAASRLGRMDAEAASPSLSSTVAGPSTLWRLAERRSRKAGSGNIFGGVNLRQLQRLFTAAGDQDAEQRAELVWGHGDEAELAQALIGLRARGRRRELRVEGRDTLGSRWLQAFNHLRIGKSSESSQQSKEQSSDSKTEARAKHSCPDTQPLTPKGPRGATVVREDLTEGQGPAGASERPARPGALLKKGGESDPERYLHRILH